MVEPIQPSDLYFRLQDALGSLRDVRRTVTEISRDYAELDAIELAVDELGDALTPADALGRTRAGLADVLRTLDAADDAFDGTMASSSRLLRPSTDADGRRE
ncbi:hypothetical protein GS966_27635 [Rhodococcus hoagii]|nr:hypothetical protein [Prescottella equi]NKS10241.1 hypothetical protein [Prescottella equi]NKS35232.1 hypothetical protein [Prescottella equi]NKS62079.1 hypothetical protein [Prescottella equi]NKS68251.1 hypothetical protein [Prescottella equi]